MSRLGSRYVPHTDELTHGAQRLAKAGAGIRENGEFHLHLRCNLRPHQIDHTLFHLPLICGHGLKVPGSRHPYRKFTDSAGAGCLQSRIVQDWQISISTAITHCSNI